MNPNNSGTFQPAQQTTAKASAGYSQFYANVPQAQGKRNKRQQNKTTHQYFQPPGIVSQPQWNYTTTAQPMFPPPRPVTIPSTRAPIQIHYRPVTHKMRTNHTTIGETTTLSQNTTANTNHTTIGETTLTPTNTYHTTIGTTAISSNNITTATHSPIEQPATAIPETKPSTNTTASQNQETKPQNEWPPSMQSYIVRAFDSCRTKPEQDQLTKILHAKISQGISDGTLWKTNWDIEPIPTISKPPTPMAPFQVNARPPRPIKVQTARPTFEAESEFIPLSTNQKPGSAGKRKSKMAINPEDHAKKAQRQQRFKQTKAQKKATAAFRLNDGYTHATVLKDDGELDLEAMTIKGTCQTVEKEYLRLTSAPHPQTVRPEPILHKALKMVRSKWKRKECDYIYACSQLKSIRQDLTVQRIKNSFTVKVYEKHARIALEQGDMNEFNQCQTQLRDLYALNVGNEISMSEFKAYRILYCAYTQDQQSNPATGRIEMNRVLSELSPSDRKNKAIAHALKVREALASDNYYYFFQLYDNVPNLGHCIMDKILPRVRLQSLRIMCASFRPKLTLSYICDLLRLHDLNEAERIEFLRGAGLNCPDGYSGPNAFVDTKASEIVSSLSKTSLI